MKTKINWLPQRVNDWGDHLKEGYGNLANVELGTRMYTMVYPDGAATETAKTLVRWNVQRIIREDLIAYEMFHLENQFFEPAVTEGFYEGGEP